jgi:hypothetical protein
MAAMLSYAKNGEVFTFITIVIREYLRYFERINFLGNANLRDDAI